MNDNVLITILRLDADSPASAVAPITNGRCVWLIEADGLSDDQRDWKEEIEASPFNHEVIVGSYQDLVERAGELIQEGMIRALQGASQ